MERFEELYIELEAGRLGCEDAAMILGCSTRHFLRLRSRYDEAGLEGLRDRRVGRVSRHRAADAEVEELTRLYRTRYDGFNTRHFHEFARRDHALRRGYRALQDDDVADSAKPTSPPLCQNTCPGASLPR